MAASEVTQRIALVTGASRGIGRSIATRLAADGHHVVLVARSESSLTELCAEIEAAGGNATVRTCDVSDQEAVAGLVEGTASELGRLDIMVNNAGVTRDGLLMRMSDDDFMEVLTINLRSIFTACRAAARPMMRQRFGRIVNIGSITGLIGNAGQANYAAAKAGLVGLTKTVAKELGSKGVTANVVAPGFIETSMTEQLPQSVRDDYASRIPARRFGQPEEIAHCVSYLASEGAGYMTGQVLVVDGGLVC